MVKLGTTYRDTITGYEGIATAICRYLSGCVQITLEGEYNKDKNEFPAWWVDETRLEHVRKKKDVKVTAKKDAPAGPQNTPGPQIGKA